MRPISRLTLVAKELKPSLEVSVFGENSPNIRKRDLEGTGATGVILTWSTVKITSTGVNGCVACTLFGLL